MFQYAIQPGDTIYSISAQFDVPVHAILAANPGLYPYSLVVGQIILIPTNYAYPPYPVYPSYPVFPVFPVFPIFPFRRFPRRRFMPGRPGMPGQPGPGMPHVPGMTGGRR